MLFHAATVKSELSPSLASICFCPCRGAWKRLVDVIVSKVRSALTPPSPVPSPTSPRSRTAIPLVLRPQAARGRGHAHFPKEPHKDHAFSQRPAA
ncbi:hypothetical protein IAQ61_011194 [Plenodomus lingam]|uniref:uncharacterized protein n=1 Tax=Leptosphaeria maculans TaxID=5022 RepID=UPI00331F2B69|nr:hypothetical protein IAQ61_011194 [Plenodomus lingam]